MPILDETILTLTEATRHLPPRGGRRVAVSTLWRWARKGCGGVRLEYAKLGRAIYTSREALSRFSEALAAADRPMPVEPARSPAPSPIRTPDARSRDVATAKAQLNAAGI